MTKPHQHLEREWQLEPELQLGKRLHRQLSGTAPRGKMGADLRDAFGAALPLLISLSMISAISIVDIFLAGVLGPGAQAALGIADQIVFLNMLVMTGFCAGINALVSRSVGACDENEAQLYIRYSMCASALVGALATFVGLSAADFVAGIFAADPAVMRQASTFIRLCALGNLPWALVMCQGAILRASGRAGLGIAQWFIITFLCIGTELAAFYLIPGGRSMVPMAVSWDIAILAGYLVGARSLRQLAPVSGPFLWRQFFHYGRSVCAVGLPVIVGDMCWLLSNLLLFSLLSILPHPTAAQAAWTLQLKIEEAIAYVPLMACCQATASLVGQRLGAGDALGARRMSRRVAHFASVAMFAVGCLTALLAPYAVRYCSSDPEVIILAQKLLLGSIVTFPMNAMALVLASAFDGAGATMLPMIVNIIGLVMVRLPFAWVLALPAGFGVAGAWAAKCLSTLITACGMAAVFIFSDWLKTARPSKQLVRDFLFCTRGGPKARLPVRGE